MKQHLNIAAAARLSSQLRALRFHSILSLLSILVAACSSPPKTLEDCRGGCLWDHPTSSEEIAACRDIIRREPAPTLAECTARGMYSIEVPVPDDIGEPRYLQKHTYPCVEVIAKDRRDKYVKLHPDLSSKVRSLILKGSVQIGMTTEQTEASWGKPDRINRTGNASGIHEQWVYAGTYVYFENGVLTSWQD